MTEFVDTAEVAKRTSLSKDFWVQKRIRGTDPVPFFKVGSRVLYKWADVEAWMEAKARNNTSERADAQG